MGQIANQMLLEWCDKMFRKLADKKKNRSGNGTPVQKKTDRNTRIQEKSEGKTTP